MKTTDLARYIFSFLLGEDDPLATLNCSGTDLAAASDAIACQRPSSLICYTDDVQEARNYRVAVFKSGFFHFERYGRPASMPMLPLLQWHGTPLLFGSPKEEEIDGNGHPTLILYADVIASSYFLLSRYEEMYRRGERDEYGRFPGRESLPARAGFLLRPIVDEYGAHLRNTLRRCGIPVPDISPRFRAVNLTHDLDQPWAYRGLRGLLRAVLKEGMNPVKAYKAALGSPSNDPYFSFERFLDRNRDFKKAAQSPVNTIFFYKTPGGEPEDKPNYTLRGPAMRKVLRLAKRNGVLAGLHINLSCSRNPDLIPQAHHRLEKTLGTQINMARYHFLAAREPEDFLALRAADITEDFTMGYPDVAGFRLGTCRPVRFILPSTGVVTDLVLHPLSFMDYTLHSPKYMNLNFEAATQLTQTIINQTYLHAGELNLLFHNENLAKETPTYHLRLYRQLLSYILSVEQENTPLPHTPSR